MRMSCLRRRLALEGHERLVFQMLISSMLDALSQHGREQPWACSDVCRRFGDGPATPFWARNVEGMTQGGVRWWKADKFRKLLHHLMLGAVRAVQEACASPKTCMQRCASLESPPDSSSEKFSSVVVCGCTCRRASAASAGTHLCQRTTL
jgi:hypothetical protein